MNTQLNSVSTANAATSAAQTTQREGLIGWITANPATGEQSFKPAAQAEAQSPFDTRLDAYRELLASVTVETRWRGGDNWTPSNINEAVTVVLANLDDSTAPAVHAAHNIRNAWFEESLAHLDRVDDALELHNCMQEVEDAEREAAEGLDESEGIYTWDLIRSCEITAQPQGWDDMCSAEKIVWVQEHLAASQDWDVENLVAAINTLPAAASVSGD